jgi:hypothetical protein
LVCSAILHRAKRKELLKPRFKAPRVSQILRTVGKFCLYPLLKHSKGAATVDMWLCRPMCEEMSQEGDSEKQLMVLQQSKLCCPGLDRSNGTKQRWQKGRNRGTNRFAITTLRFLFVELWSIGLFAPSNGQCQFSTLVLNALLSWISRNNEPSQLLFTLSCAQLLYIRHPTGNANFQLFYS